MRPGPYSEVIRSDIVNLFLCRENHSTAMLKTILFTFQVHVWAFSIQISWIFSWLGHGTAAKNGPMLYSYLLLRSILFSFQLEFITALFTLSCNALSSQTSDWLKITVLQLSDTIRKVPLNSFAQTAEFHILLSSKLNNWQSLIFQLIRDSTN